MSVCAAVFQGDGEEALAATLAALDRQTRPPEERVVVRQPSATAAVRAALKRPADWLWLLDGSAVPEPDALERLLEALDRLGPLPPPVLLASKVVGPGGAPDPGTLPLPRVVDIEEGAAAFERRLLPVRTVRHGSLLVQRSGLEAHLPADDALAWSARLLKERLGVLVPASVAVRRAPTPARPDLAGRLRLLASDALKAGEKPRFAVRLAEDALAARRAGRGERRGRSPG